MGDVDDESQETVEDFMQELQSVAYPGVKPGRRLWVLVNPKAGPVSRSTSFSRGVFS